jgi:mRNA-degrading endonuclease RelE of RelBE toxin-antitoxin system
VLYQIDTEAHEVTVVDVSHRADTYGPRSRRAKR